MQSTSTIRLYSLDYSSSKTYLMALLFVIGNITLPQLVHLLPQGGLVWLPIYMFTLIGAYKYGWKVGLLTVSGLSDDQFSLIRNALCKCSPGYTYEIYYSCLNGRLRCQPFQKSFALDACRSSVVISSCWHLRRVDFEWQFLSCLAGPPNRHPWLTSSDFRRLGNHQLYNQKIK